jgi:cytidine deaminase
MISVTTELADAVKVALEYREQARTFRSKVGVAFVMDDGKIIGGFNIETYGHSGFHAEVVALIRALADITYDDVLGCKVGYNGTNFKQLVVVFQDAGHDDVEIFPACISCWSWLWEFTHPDLEIVVADIKGNIHYKCLLKNIVHPPPPAEVFPSEKIKQIKPRTNSEPKPLRR